MTKEQFLAKKAEYESNMLEAYELLKKDPEGYSDEGCRLRELIEEMQSYEEWQKNFRRDLLRWKWRAE